jgi:hypothetical protein
VNLLKVEESIISAREKKDYVCSLCRWVKLKNINKDKLKCYLQV